MYRQGDLLLLSADKAELKGHQEVDTAAEIVLAGEESTGHSHRVLGKNIKAFARRPRSSVGHKVSIDFVDISNGGTLTHPAHIEISIPAGLYRICRRREYDPSSPLLRVLYVAD